MLRHICWYIRLGEERRGIVSAEEPVHNFAPCSYCSGPLKRDTGPFCDACESFIHRDCWKEFEGCPTYGCENSPDMRAKASSQEMS